MGLALLQEADRPVASRFITVEGTRLHYIDRGRGTPVVLLHGNGSMIGDFLSSGITGCAEAGCRVVAFDRPGFGYSERPRGRRWGPLEQARLLLRAFALLGIERPIVVGHSWGTLVAVALALESGQDVAGLVLLSGYYYPVPRPRQNAASVSAFSLVDDVVRQAVMPFVWRLAAPGAVKKIFAPCAVPERFKQAYSMADALRPSQMKAVEEEAAMLGEAARSLAVLYRELSVPIRLIAGSDDRIVETEKQSVRLHRELANSTLRVVPGCGHMVHHAVPEEVMGAIVGMDEGRGSRAAPARRTVQASMPRHWLHIGEDAIESHHAARPLAAAHGTHAGYAVASAT
jgi:pimeloyl-ACP methyl ester carboxylesterase